MRLWRGWKAGDPADQQRPIMPLMLYSAVGFCRLLRTRRRWRRQRVFCPGVALAGYGGDRAARLRRCVGMGHTAAPLRWLAVGARDAASGLLVVRDVLGR